MDDLRLLRVFREVALRGSFSEAAGALAYTQPAVSQQIARLEKSIGTRLINREPKRLRLTQAGEIVLRHTEKLLAQITDAEAELAELTAGRRGQVRIASMPTTAGTFVGRAISAFRRERPGIDLDLSIALPVQAVERVRKGDAEIAISQERGFGIDPDHAGLYVQHLIDDPLYAVLGTDHPLATQTTIALKDLARWPLVLLAVPDATGDENLILRAFADAGAEPEIAHTFHDHFAVEGVVAAGMGVALLPGLALAAARVDLAIRPLRGTPPRRQLLAVAADPPASATQAMIDSLRDAAESQPGPFPRTAPGR
jgi:DNA-binding transcriptional LysR family regulator